MDFTWASITQLIAAIGIILLIMMVPVPASPYCMTRAEAREKWPKRHLYWHTEHRCWDATRHWPASRRALAQVKTTPRTAVPAPVALPKPARIKEHTEDYCCWPNIDDLKAHLKGEPK